MHYGAPAGLVRGNCPHNVRVICSAHVLIAPGQAGQASMLEILAWLTFALAVYIAIVVTLIRANQP
jgi:hypothetical protein